MAGSEEELKRLLMKVKKESEKAGLKLNIQKPQSCIWSHHFMANRWRKMETTRCYFVGLQNHVDGDCSHEMQGLTLFK